ncbi:MAG: DUF86 domain-containing protein [Betaproteobacteria bacterium]|nr:DUF86 domain-containing protein [Betaproteobacteria bacterium]
MRADDAVRIRHMIDAAESALDFTRGRTRIDLDKDTMLQFALVRAVEVVGEAASKISAEGRAELPQVRWAAIMVMRNRLAHAYFEIDMDILWITLQQALPALLAQLKSKQLLE